MVKYCKQNKVYIFFKLYNTIFFTDLMNRVNYLGDELVGMKQSVKLVIELNDTLRKNRQEELDADYDEDVKELFPMNRKRDLKKLDNLLQEKRWRRKIVSLNKIDNFLLKI